jgi:hypothetical protein
MVEIVPVPGTVFRDFTRVNKAERPEKLPQQGRQEPLRFAAISADAPQLPLLFERHYADIPVCGKRRMTYVQVSWMFG